MAFDNGHYHICSHENVSSNGERISGGNVREVLTRMELDLAYSSEKVLNLEMLMMQVTDRASDYELQTSSSEELSMDFIEKAFEYDILSGILSSEVKEIESFMSCLQMDILAAHKFTPSDLLEDSLIEIEEKLYHAEESLRNSIDQVADIRKQSAKFERSLAFGTSTNEDLENGQMPPMNAKWNLQTVEQKRHCLQSLEKSLGREIDLEKKLSESRYNEEELKMKLHFAEQEVDCLEDLFERILVGFFEAENSAEILLGISKEIIVKVQIAQLSSSSSFLQSEVESEMDKSMMKPPNGQREMKNVETSYTEPDGFPVLVKTYLRSNLKEVEDNCIATSSEISTLRCRINALGEQLRETEDHLLIAKVCVKENKEQQSMLYTERGDMDNLISSLKEKVLEIQSRAESAEARCAELIKQSVELNDEVGFLRSNGTEKVKLLERKLKESDSQLEHANASVAAIEEQKNMLYSALNDMQNLIDDLKGKVSKAESRAESAESKCSLLTETNLELNEELTFLRGRLECLEVSLRQSERAKLATAKDICSRTKLITELVKKLGLEREHLQLQISALTKRNKTLMKYQRTRDGSSYNMNHQETRNIVNHDSVKTSDQTPSELIFMDFQADIPISTMTSDMKMDPTLSAEDPLSSVSNVEAVRTIEATQLNWKYVLMAFLVLMVSIASVYLFHLQKF